MITVVGINIRKSIVKKRLPLCSVSNDANELLSIYFAKVDMNTFFAPAKVASS